LVPALQSINPLAKAHQTPHLERILRRIHTLALFEYQLEKAQKLAEKLVALSPDCATQPIVKQILKLDADDIVLTKIKYHPEDFNVADLSGIENRIAAKLKDNQAIIHFHFEEEGEDYVALIEVGDAHTTAPYLRFGSGRGHFPKDAYLTVDEDGQILVMDEDSNWKLLWREDDPCPTTTLISKISEETLRKIGGLEPAPADESAPADEPEAEEKPLETIIGTTKVITDSIRSESLYDPRTDDFDIDMTYATLAQDVEVSILGPLGEEKTITLRTGTEEVGLYVNGKVGDFLATLLPDHLQLDGITFTGDVYLYESGRVMHGTLKDPSTFQVVAGNVSFVADSGVYFHENGTLFMGYLDTEAPINGLQIPGNSYVTFDDQGRLRKVKLSTDLYIHALEITKSAGDVLEFDEHGGFILDEE